MVDVILEGICFRFICFVLVFLFEARKGMSRFFCGWGWKRGIRVVLKKRSRSV